MARGRYLSKTGEEACASELEPTLLNKSRLLALEIAISNAGPYSTHGGTDYKGSRHLQIATRGFTVSDRLYLSHSTV